MLRKSMKRKYKKTPSIQLQEYLITYGNSLAIVDLVGKVTSNKKSLKEKVLMLMDQQ